MEIALRRNDFQPRHVKKLVRVLEKGKRNEFYAKLIAYGKAHNYEARAEYGAYTESEKKDAKLALEDAHNALKESFSLLDVKEHESVEKKALVIKNGVKKFACAGIVAGCVSIMAAIALAPSVYFATNSTAIGVSAGIVAISATVAAVLYVMTRDSKADNLERKIRWLLSEIRSERENTRIFAEVKRGYPVPLYVETSAESDTLLLPKAKKLLPTSFEE
ncbi:MAG: hypothetical protein WCT52_03550 [Candidatus Micrarchaeia archaeon]